MVTVSVSRYSTGGNMGCTGGNAHAADVRAHTNGNSFFIKHILSDMRAAHKPQIARTPPFDKKFFENKSANFPFSWKQYKWAGAMPGRVRREEYKSAEAELCAYANDHHEVFEGTDGTSGWGATDTVEYVMSGGMTVERADGGKLTDREFLKGLPRKYVRVKFELNKAKIKADGLEDADLAALGLVRVGTLGLKLKAKAA